MDKRTIDKVICKLAPETQERLVRIAQLQNKTVDAVVMTLLTDMVESDKKELKKLTTAHRKLAMTKENAKVNKGRRDAIEKRIAELKEELKTWKVING